jgi:hypothetical protein
MNGILSKRSGGLFRHVWHGRRSCQACHRPETPGFSPGSGFIYGIPGLLIIFGAYKIFSGRTLKKPTKSPFDSILGDSAHEKDESDELPYIFCPRCRKQLLIELKYKHCPNCGYNLK